MKTLIATAMLMAATAFPVVAQEAGQKTFPTPDAASKALVAAVTAKDTNLMLSLVGGSAKEILGSGDAKADAADHAAFLKACQEKLQLVPLDDTHTMMVIGKDNFPFAVPLTKAGKVWYFDGALGLQEVKARRIGANELSVIRACEGYVAAQREYAAMDADGTGMAKYADRFESSKGKHDGLYWSPAPGETASPLGPLLSAAGTTSADAGKPFHGYRFRILTSQGADAPGGAYSYKINQNMVAGFALVAYPATYGETGIMTFIVGPSGVVYQQDLKDKTSQLGAAMTEFNPDKGWKRI